MQTINRNNYEEIFLLYVDNELDASLKAEVESFVQQNPDLAIELEMFQQAKALPEAFVFADKEILLRTEGDSIDEHNHQEYFLLYIDNELSEAKRAEVERYVLQHPALQDEFTTLKQAVLTPEVVSYGNKEGLYRTEKRRTVYFKPWQFAAAAVFIGVCLAGWLMMQKPSSEGTIAKVPVTVKPDVAAAKPDVTAEENTLKNIEPQTTEQPVIQQQSIAHQATELVKKHKDNAVRLVKKDREVEPVTVMSVKEDETPQIAVVQHPSLTHKQLVDPKEPPTATPGVTVVQEAGSQQNNVASLQASGKTENIKAYPVAYKELNTNDDDNSLHVGMFDLNKTKVTNLFKKAGRVFGKKSNNLSDEDGKLQVASFEIDTKNQ